LFSVCTSDPLRRGTALCGKLTKSLGVMGYKMAMKDSWLGGLEKAKGTL
jgi:hypothetical protein